MKLSLDQNECDILMGVPAELDVVLTTKPYYESTYVFVSRKDRYLNVKSLGDDGLTNGVLGFILWGMIMRRPRKLWRDGVCRKSCRLQSLW